MKKLFLTLTATVLAGVVFAQGPDAGRMGPRGPRGGEMFNMDMIARVVQNPQVAEKLGLTAEQTAKLAELKTTNRAATSETQKKIRAAMGKQTELLKAEKVDEAAIMALIDEVFELRKAIAKEQMKKVISVRTILTPEQITKVREVMKEMRGKRGEGRRPRGKAKEAKTPEAKPTPPPEA